MKIELNLTLLKIYEAEGRINLFDKFLNVFDLDPDYLQDVFTFCGHLILGINTRYILR